MVFSAVSIAGDNPGRKERASKPRMINLFRQRYDHELGYNIVDELDRIAKDHQASISQAALNYVRQKPWITSTIVGARNADQFAENFKAVDWKLTPEEISRLDKISEPDPFVPLCTGITNSITKLKIQAIPRLNTSYGIAWILFCKYFLRAEAA